MRFLVCLDDTPFSETILAPVSKLAQASAAELELITVVQDESSSGEPHRLADAGELEQTGSEAEREAKAALERAAAHLPGVTRTTVLLGNVPADVIVRYARTSRPDLIALATHSRGVVGDVVLGSTAQGVTAAGIGPMLLLRPRAASRMRREDLPIGVFVVTWDHMPLGKLTGLEGDDMVIRSANGAELRLPVSLAFAISTGPLVLDIDSADLNPAPEAGNCEGLREPAFP